MHQVYVIDSCSLIDTKKRIKPAYQWDFFNDTMTNMVECGGLIVTTQVERECGKVQHPDVPGAWVLAKASASPHIRDPSYGMVATVMTEWPDLIDPEKETEDADPYVIARALEFQRDGQAVCVVTDETIKHPQRVTVSTVCAAYSIDAIKLDQFLGAEHLNVPSNWLRPIKTAHSD